MAIFEDVIIKWDGEERTIPHNKVMLLIARVEHVITLQEISDYMSREVAPLGRLSLAYAEVLKYAGFSVSGDEVYSKLLQAGDKADIGISVITSLLQMMVPPAALDIKQPVASGGKPAGKKKAAKHS